MRLSSRDILVKEAFDLNDFIQGFASTTEKKLQLKTHPFESLLSTVAPFIIGRTFFGKALLMLGEHFGIGFGTWFGRWLDKKLGFGDPNNIPNLSEGALYSAAAEGTDEYLDQLKQKVSTASSNGQFYKRAGLLDHLKKTFGLLSGGKYRVGLVSIIYKLAMYVAMGLMGAGIIGGLVRMLSGPSEEETMKEERKSATQGTPRQHYANVKDDIEQTLINYLDVGIPEIPNSDGQVRNFSQTFKFSKKYPLSGSSEMREILQDIVNNYGQSLSQINHYTTFWGPQIKDVARKIMPEIQFGQTPKDELRKLLQGAIHE